ncbi:hypothetical protein OG613_47840 (plasmid) [Streptomyces sp. NBC_00015]|uniref:hypothetical protein n=1 Tax=Streptomyces sp. NBC_00015 TaxID=2903611 RepID=UPI002F913B54
MPGKEFAVAIPAADEGAVKPWRKLLRGLDDSRHGALSCLGDWLEAGASYELPSDAVIVLCDPLPGGDKKRVRIWRVKRNGTIKEERDSTLGSANAFGTSVRGTMRRLVDKYPPPPGAVRQLTAAPPRVNERADTCQLCRQTVAAREGILVRNQRGYTQAQHQPGQCPPPPPMANGFAQECGRCGGWLEKGEGVLYEAAPALHGRAVFKARHPQDCPPADQRAAPPPRANLREQDCMLCGHLVAAGTGLLVRLGAGWEVRHPEGKCLPKEELWEITRGEPGPYRTRPERWAPAGTVLRSTLYDHHHRFPDTAPGFHPVPDGVVSAIVTTVRERRPEYCRDEDGNQPTELIGEDGWYFRILVRPATADEAADILAAEEAQQLRTELAARRRRLFELCDDGEVPETVDLSGAVQVDFGAARSLHQHWPDDELHVDEQARIAWFLRYNGADGDDWSLSNYGPFIARRLPLTEERAHLVADFRAEYASGDAPAAPSGARCRAATPARPAGPPNASAPSPPAPPSAMPPATP